MRSPRLVIRALLASGVLTIAHAAFAQATYSVEEPDTPNAPAPQWRGGAALPGAQAPRAGTQTGPEQQVPGKDAPGAIQSPAFEQARKRVYAAYCQDPRNAGVPACAAAQPTR